MILEIKNISYTYPGMKKKTLDGCSLDLQEGEVLTILGPNGAGKSTLLNCICGLLSPQEGEIRVCGRPVKGMSVKEVAGLVGYVQQNYSPVFGYSVLHFVMMGAAPHVGLFGKPSREDEERAMEVLESLGIRHLADKPYTEISGGERQQATIARVIVQNPKLILFDEPTAHLDYGKQLLILRMIKTMADQGYTAIMTTHNPDHAIMLGGRVALVDPAGGVEAGMSGEVLTEKRLAGLYQTDLKLRYLDEFSRTVCIPKGLS